MMDCQQAFALLQDILDKEASQIDEKEVRAHLEKCSHCFAKFRLEESIQEFLNEKIKSSATNESKPDRLESMRLNLMNQLDDIDAECTKTKKSVFGGSLKIFLSTAALVVLTGVWYLSAGFFDHNKYFIPFEKAHWTVSENVAPFTQVSNKNAYLESVAQNFNYNVTSSFAGYSFIGGKKATIMDTDLEHLIFSNDKDFISIFITGGDNVEIPNDLESLLSENGNAELFDHNCRGCRLVFHKVGSLVIITASTSKDIDLTEFIPGQLAI